MSDTKITILDATGKTWQNLIGVFSREFPIAVGHARATGQPQRVTYYGDDYTISASVAETMISYNIIANCNFESRDDETGKAVHAARKAIEGGTNCGQEIVEAMDTLESVLTEHADSEYSEAIRMCERAESDVASLWVASQE